MAIVAPEDWSGTDGLCIERRIGLVVRAGRVQNTSQQGKERTRYSGIASVILAFGWGLTGCQGDPSAVLAPNSTGIGLDNSAPKISGDPPAAIAAAEYYFFTPTIEDAEGDDLAITVEDLPDWARFDSESGSISGTPTESDIGIYTGISITVSDGNLSDTLGPFSIEVIQQGAAPGSVILRWTAPAANTDGSTLRDLAGYRIYWGPSFGNYHTIVSIENPSVNRYVIENLAPGSYTFVATALNAAGVESSHSQTATATVP